MSAPVPGHDCELAGSDQWQGRGAAAIERPSSRYAIAFSAGKDDEVLERFAVNAWLPSSVRELVAIRRGGRQ